MPSAETVSGKRILVVDDELPLASLIAEILSAEGHHVDTASNGLAALARVEQTEYDLILSDLRMPELDGPGFYRELERRRPDLLTRIAFVSGSAHTANMEHFLEKTGVPVLYKPFRMEQLTKLATALLDRKA